MKKSILYLCFTLPLLSIILSGCPKKTDPEPTIIGKWKQISGVYSPAYMGTTDYFTDYLHCYNDNIWEFKSDGALEVTEGTTKCDPDDPQIYFTTTYQITNKTIYLYGGYPYTYQLSGNTLTITYTWTDTGKTYTRTETFQRQ
jgi:hypothetical protein